MNIKEQINLLVKQHALFLGIVNFAIINAYVRNICLDYLIEHSIFNKFFLIINIIIFIFSKLTVK